MFKYCPSCGFEWQHRQDFLKDPEILMVGYQVNFERLEAGLILFNHSCKGTLAIHAGEFADLYCGPILSRRVTGSEQCPSYCLHQDDLRPCPELCECAYVRNILQIIRQWPKRRKVEHG